MTDEPLLTPSQVAAILGKERTTVFRIDEADLPYVLTKGGPARKGHRRYKQSDVDKYLGRQTSGDLAERVARLEQRMDDVEGRLG